MSIKKQTYTFTNVIILPLDWYQKLLESWDDQWNIIFRNPIKYIEFISFVMHAVVSYIYNIIHLNQRAPSKCYLSSQRWTNILFNFLTGGQILFSFDKIIIRIMYITLWQIRRTWSSSSKLIKQCSYLRTYHKITDLVYLHSGLGKIHRKKVSKYKI